MAIWTTRIYRKEEKIYRGAFIYYRNDNNYAEENFDVYRDRKEQTHHYISEAVVIVTTGEILNLKVEYIVNKEYIPTYVSIQKIMGKENSKETYEYNMKKNIIIYNFSNSKGENQLVELSTAPKFHITTPTAVSSMLFLRSKKIDSSGKNSFNLLSSNNLWDFKSEPKFKNIVLERASLTMEKINIDSQNVQATLYKMYDEETDFKKIKDPEHIKIYLSQHGAIPYLLKTSDSTKIQIKFLNDLTEKD